MSAKTDQYEIQVAKWINKTTENIAAVRPKASSAYSDVYLTKPGYSPVWLEIKSNHGDNLVNPRVYYDGQWQTTYSSYSAKITVGLLNTNRETKQFIRSLSEFAEIPVEQLKIPTNKAQFKDEPGAISIETLKEYFEIAAPNRYIANVVSYDIGSLVTRDLIERDHPVSYIQIGDDFYMVGQANPFELPSDIPLIEGYGDFKVRVSTRSEYSEVQAELKLDTIDRSQYSCMPGTHKINPFDPKEPWYFQ